MHPQIREKENIPCPLCGMDLVPIDPVKTESKDSTSTHEGHNDESSSPTIHLQEAKNTVLSVDTVPAGTQLMLQKIQIFGEVQSISDKHVSLTWDYPGRIEKVLIDFNTTEIEKGQPLYKVYSAKAIADQETYLETLRQRWLRTFHERELINAKLATIAARLKRIGFTDQNLEQLAKSKNPKELIRTTFTIRSPIKGSILAPLMLRGETFTSDQHLAHLAPLYKVWFIGQAYEKDLSYLKLKQRVHITSQARPGQSYIGTLVYIGRMLDPKTRTLSVRFEVDNPELELLPNLSGTAQLNIPLRNITIAVPHSAVIETGQRTIVYVQESKGVYQQREVTLGRRTSEHIEILKGIQANEQVVTQGAFLLDAEAEISGQSSK